MANNTGWIQDIVEKLMYHSHAVNSNQKKAMREAADILTKSLNPNLQDIILNTIEDTDVIQTTSHFERVKLAKQIATNVVLAGYQKS